MGPRKKLNNAIARWHSNARPASGDLEQAYADRMEAEMQEMAIQLHRVSTVLHTPFRSVEMSLCVYLDVVTKTPPFQDYTSLSCEKFCCVPKVTLS